MSVDSLHCPRCLRELLRSDAEGLFHARPPERCGGCGSLKPLRDAVYDLVEFLPTPWPPPGMVFADRRAGED
jgi:hypothetical protein